MNIGILQSGFKGVGIKHISKEYLSGLKIPLPSLGIQQECIDIWKTKAEEINKVDKEIKLLEYLVNRASATNLVLHLYKNNIDPEDGSHGISGRNFSTGTFVEASVAATTLAGSNWTTTQTSSGVTAAEYVSGITFSFSSGESVYGYYVTDTTNNILWAERFSGAPFQLPSAGGDIAIRPKLGLSS
jgi:hypothetical protein